jgi:TolB-like protein/Tfp pilus assembly protein PilF
MTRHPSLLAELQRRNVVRMAGLYLVGAWLMTQVASTVLPMFDAPGWLPRTIVTLLAIGFLPAMVFAWVFELTPGGLKLDADVLPEDSIGLQTARRMDRAIIVVLAIALIYFGFDKFVLAPRREASLVTEAQHEGARREAVKVSAKSIAVLPLANLSGDAEQQYFSDGLTENLITALSQFDGLQVIGRSSAFQFRDSRESSKAIGAKLGVANLLEGSVRKLGNTVRINAQLVDATTGRALWSQRYDRPYQDLFALQDEITQAVAAALSARLLDRTKAAAQSDRPPGGNLDAYTAWLQGAFQRDLRTVDSYRRAIGYFDRAIELDPGYALAYAGRAYTRANLAGNFGGEEKQRINAQAHADARRALALAPQLAEAHLAMGRVLRNADLDPKAAEVEYRKAVALAPEAPRPLQHLGGVLANLGQQAPSLTLLQRALRLDPLNADLHRDMASILTAVGRLDDAERQLRKAIELRPEAGRNHGMLGKIAVLRGDWAAALREAEAEPPGWVHDQVLALAHQMGPDRAIADAALRGFVAQHADASAFQVAELYALRKQPDEAFAWLERAYAARDPGVTELWISPFLLAYRNDPRFTAFCRKAQLPTPAELDANGIAASQGIRDGVQAGPVQERLAVASP